MPDYLRKWNDRIILVRPTKWDGAEELPPFDCLDITEARTHYILPHILEPIIAAEIRKNYKLYRSRPFCRKYVGNPRMNNPFFGCCVVATEALYFLTPEDRKPVCHRAMDAEGIFHWWLEYYVEGNDKVIIQDATAEQFDGLTFPPPYENGKKTALTGWKASPSKRTLDLIENITFHHDTNILNQKGKSIRYRTFDGSNFMPVDEETGNIDLDLIINTFD